MAIFNSSNVSNKTSTNDSNTAIITSGTKIKGELTLSCKLYVDGAIEGVIQSSQNITVGQNGHIKGDISVNKITVQGLVEGTINAEIVEIKSSGHIKGEIHSYELIIESKGIFEGNSIIKEQQKTLPKNKKHAEH